MKIRSIGRIVLLVALVIAPFAVRYVRAACDQEQARSMSCPLAQVFCGACAGGQGGLGGNCTSCTQSTPSTDDFGCKNNIGQQTNCNQELDANKKPVTRLCNTMYGCRVSGNNCVPNYKSQLQPQNANVWETDECPGQE